MQYSSRPGGNYLENPVYFDIIPGLSSQSEDSGATFVVNEDDRAPLTANMMVNTDADDVKGREAVSGGNSLSVKYSTNGQEYEELSNI